MAEPISAACGAWDDLWGAGFLDPVLGNTGNGTHLLYPVDLPNDFDKYALAKRPKKRPLLHAQQETAGMTARARSTAKSWLKQEDYSNICAVTDQLMELTRLQATDERPLAPRLGLDAQIF